MGIFEKLLALAGMAQQNTLDMIDSSYRCCELTMTGSPDELSAEMRNFLNLRYEAGAIALQSFSVVANTHEQPAEPRIIRKRAA